jgi:hypothetical protein
MERRRFVICIMLVAAVVAGISGAFGRFARLRIVNLAPYEVVARVRWSPGAADLRTLVDTLAAGEVLSTLAYFRPISEPRFTLQASVVDSEFESWLFGRRLDAVSWGVDVAAEWGPVGFETVGLPSPHPADTSRIISVSEDLDLARKEARELAGVLRLRKEWMERGETNERYRVAAELQDDDAFERGVFVAAMPGAHPLDAADGLLPGDIIVDAGLGKASLNEIYGTEDLMRIVSTSAEDRGIDQSLLIHVARLNSQGTVRDTSVRSWPWFNLAEWPRSRNGGFAAAARGILHVLSLGLDSQLLCAGAEMLGGEKADARCPVRRTNERALLSQQHRDAYSIGQLVAPVSMLGVVRPLLAARKGSRLTTAAALGAVEFATVSAVTEGPGKSRLLAAAKGAPVGATSGLVLAVLLR